jgi:hypothetical protein
VRQEASLPDPDRLAELDTTLERLESLGRDLVTGSRLTQAHELEVTAANYRLLAVWRELQDASVLLNLQSAEQLEFLLELQHAHGAIGQRLREVEYELDRIRHSSASSSQPPTPEAAYRLRTRSQRLLDALGDLRGVLRSSAA